MPPIPPPPALAYSLDPPANAEASANDLSDFFYDFTGVPKILATRDGSNVIIKEIGSPAYSKYILYRASDHRATFSPTANGVSLPYTDTGLSTSLNYKYKAAFYAEGVKDGNAYTEQGSLSNPVYTVGTNRL